jgi:drug/metabolite transporter (DMT)-like permease
MGDALNDSPAHHAPAHHGPAHDAASRARLTGLSAMAIVLVVWITFQLASRAGVRGALGPVDLLALRYVVAGVATLPWFWRRGFAGLGWRRAAAIALTAGFGFAVPAYLGFLYAPPSHSGVLLSGSLPLLTTILAVAWLGERLDRTRAVGLAVIMVGIALLGVANLSGAAPGAWRGDLWFLAGATSWAVFTVLVRRWSVAPWDAAAITNVLSAAVYLPIYVLLLSPQLGAASLREVAFQALVQGVLAALVSVVAYTRAIAALGAAPTAMAVAVVPASVAILSVPILDEPLSLTEAAGAALATVGMILTMRSLWRRG